jgi:hypothetical protein
MQDYRDAIKAYAGKLDFTQANSAQTLSRSLMSADAEFVCHLSGASHACGVSTRTTS